MVVAAGSSPEWSARRALLHSQVRTAAPICAAGSLCLWMCVMVHVCATLGDVSCVVSFSLWGVFLLVGGASALTAGPSGNIDVPDISQASSDDLHDEVGWGILTSSSSFPLISVFCGNDHRSDSWCSWLADMRRVCSEVEVAGWRERLYICIFSVKAAAELVMSQLLVVLRRWSTSLLIHNVWDTTVYTVRTESHCAARSGAVYHQ